VKRARELIYTAERQASRDVSLAGLRPEPGSSQPKSGLNATNSLSILYVHNITTTLSSLLLKSTLIRKF
jgi:hypothetical protein